MPATSSGVAVCAVVAVRNGVARSMWRRPSVVRCAGTYFVPRRIMPVVRAPAMATRKSEKCHGGHTSRTKYECENVEVHLVGMML